jgi:serine/threonine protein kinase
MRIFEAMTVMHYSLGYAHGDLKLDNMLEDAQTGDLKLLDFGSASESRKADPDVLVGNEESCMCPAWVMSYANWHAKKANEENQNQTQQIEPPFPEASKMNPKLPDVWGAFNAILTSFWVLQPGPLRQPVKMGTRVVELGGPLTLAGKKFSLCGRHALNSDMVFPETQTIGNSQWIPDPKPRDEVEAVGEFYKLARKRAGPAVAAMRRQQGSSGHVQDMIDLTVPDANQRDFGVFVRNTNIAAPGF